MEAHPLFVPLLSFIAGFIDAIAGGGGLITIPMWTLLKGPGAHVVATNKVGACASCLIALWVYQRRHPLPWREGLFFLVAISLGSLLGSGLTAYLPSKFFSWLLLMICPAILWIVWAKERLFAERPASPTQLSVFVAVGFGVGVYDGFFGPGGGTFMLLALLWFTHLPLMSALALSKLANALSAGASLTGFAYQGLVDWHWGAMSSMAIVLGAFLGARMTRERNVQVVRPALAIVVMLLMGKILWDLTRET